MVGKNNHYLKESKNNQKYQRFSLRKFSIGVVSVAIAAGFYLGSSQTVMADTTTPAVQTSEKTVAVPTSGNAASDSSAETQVNSETTAENSSSNNVAEAVTTPAAAEPATTSASDDNAVSAKLSTEKPATSANTLADSKIQTATVAKNAHNTTADQAVNKADEVTVTITYKDKTTGKTLDTETVSGKAGQKIKFNNQKILDYRDLHYIYYDSDLNGQTYQVNGKKNFTISFTHKTKPDTKNVKVTRTINVTKPDGSVTITTQTANLTGKGTHDLVTNETTWNSWTTGTWAAFDTPAVAGYTPSQATVAAENVEHNTKDQVVNIRYKANEQTATITYVDDTDHKGMRTDNAIGQFGQKIVFANDPGKQILAYKGAGYVYQDTDFINQTYQSDNAKNAYTVHFIHKTTTKDVKQTVTVTRTIHYVYGNRKEAAKDVVQTLTFKQTGTKDLVTKQITWNNVADQDFTPVDSPEIAGYTADKATVSAESANVNTKSSDVKVTYTANDADATITYVDDATGKTIKAETASGKVGQKIIFTTYPGYQIKLFEQQGYELGPNNFRFEGEYYNSDNAKNQFIVHLNHGKQADVETKQVTRTINVTNPDGTVKTTKQVAELSRTVTKDAVTGTVLEAGDWTTDIWAEFDTPTISGYTPSQATVAVEKVDNNTQDQVVNIKYTANKQTATITYIDDTDQKALKTDDAIGKFGQQIVFANDPGKQILAYRDAGYVYQGTDFNNQAYQSNDADNAYIVHFKHGTAATSRDIQASQTIHYVYSDGKKAADDNVQTVSFTQTGTKDAVTGEPLSWDSVAKSFVDVASPEIAGYTPSQAIVSGTAVNVSDKDVEMTVTYTANDAAATITYVDDATGAVIKAENASGKVGQKIVFATYPGYQIKLFEQQGYELGPNNFHFEGEYYSSDKAKNQFTVHLNHGKQADFETKQVTRTINVTNPDGTVKTTKQVAELSRTVTKDTVTGNVLENGDWTTGSWDEFTTPTIPGYTASPDSVAQQTVTSKTPDTTIAITYTADPAPVKQGNVTIEYVDQDGNEISRQVISGNVGDTIKVTPEIPAGWEPADPSIVPAEVTIRKENGQIIVVIIKHAVQDPTETKTVTRTINVTTPDGQTITTKQTVTLTRNGDLDLVTGQTTWGNWTTGTWQDFKPAAIAGYTLSQSDVPAVTVDGNTVDQVVNITYTADQETPVDPGQTTDPVEPSQPSDHNTDTSQSADQNTDTPQSTDHDTGTSQSTDHNSDTPQTGDTDTGAHYRNADATASDGNQHQQDPATTSEAPVSEAPAASANAAQAKSEPTTNPNGATPTGTTIHGAAAQLTATAVAQGTNAATIANSTTTDSTSAARTASQRLPQTGNADSTALVGLGFASLLAMFGLLDPKKGKQN